MQLPPKNWWGLFIVVKDKSVILHKGRDKSIRNRHHWIFSGAVKTLPDFIDGEILSVLSAEGDFLGKAYFNRKASIIGRMVSFNSLDAIETIYSLIDQAMAMRLKFFDHNTNAYRVINGEGDCLPGVIVDRYDDVLVIQISTLGMDRMRSQLVDYLVRKINPSCVYEKSLLPSRKEEGLEAVQGILYGNLPQELIVKENGLSFLISVEEGQKTGFFLDQRETRLQVQKLHCKRVLNCFGFTGGFTIFAIAGGAEIVDTVDISAKAIECAKRNVALNNFHTAPHGFYSEDVFHFLKGRKELPYDLVILDPPAFAKKKKDVIQACRGYKEINRQAMARMPAGSLLLTCSCSYFVDEGLFQQVLFQAAKEAKRDVKIVGKNQLAKDHPINIFHPEGDYLKGFLLYLV